jgi:hypothetical protein
MSTLVRVVTPSKGVQRKHDSYGKNSWGTYTPSDRAEYDRRRHLDRAYGLTSEQFDAMLAAQNYACAVCLSNDPSRNNGNWSIDHDHATGAVRGIVCHHCNILLGGARDNVQTLRNAVAYLERHSRG